MTSALDDATGEAQAPPERQRRRESLAAWAWSLVRLDFVGVAFGALFFCLSLTPSLLPRDWLSAGVIGGINAAIGYGIGVLIGKAFRRLFLNHRNWWPPPPEGALRHQGGHRRAVDRRQHPDADPRRGVAAADLGGDGHRGPGHARLSCAP